MYNKLGGWWKDRKKWRPRFVKFEIPIFGKATETYSQQSLNIYACMWIEWTISIRWVGLLICARVGLFWVGNINGTKFPDTARLQPIPPPMISTEKEEKSSRQGSGMVAWRLDVWLVGWEGGGAAFTKMHRSDKITSSTLLFLRGNRHWNAGTQNWDDWSGTPLLWRFLKLCKLWVFQGRKEILSEE